MSKDPCLKYSFKRLIVVSQPVSLRRALTYRARHQGSKEEEDCTSINSQFSLVKFSSVALTTASSKMFDCARNMVSACSSAGRGLVRGVCRGRSCADQYNEGKTQGEAPGDKDEVGKQKLCRGAVGPCRRMVASYASGLELLTSALASHEWIIAR